MAAPRPSMEPARTERPDGVMTRLSKEAAAIRVVLPFVFETQVVEFGPDVAANKDMARG